MLYYESFCFALRVCRVYLKSVIWNWNLIKHHATDKPQSTIPHSAPERQGLWNWFSFSRSHQTLSVLYWFIHFLPVNKERNRTDSMKVYAAVHGLWLNVGVDKNRLVKKKKKKHCVLIAVSRMFNWFCSSIRILDKIIYSLIAEKKAFTSSKTVLKPPTPAYQHNELKEWIQFSFICYIARRKVARGRHHRFVNVLNGKFVLARLRGGDECSVVGYTDTCGITDKISAGRNFKASYLPMILGKQLTYHRYLWCRRVMLLRVQGH